MTEFQLYLINNINNAIHLSVRTIDGGRPIPAGIKSVDADNNTVTFLVGRALWEIKEVENKKLPPEQERAAIIAITENPTNLRTISIDEIAFS